MKYLPSALILAVLLPGVAGADSIWDRREPRSAFLFYDNRARRIGDLLTVVILETTDIANNDQKQMSKDTKAGSIFNFKGSTKGGKLARDGQVDFDASGSSTRSFDSKSQLSIDQRFTDRMSVIVIDVLPNGNLVVEGFKQVVVGGEVRTIRISGIVRPIDISLANSVLSQAIANFQITYLGNGPTSRYVKQGYLGRIFNFIWPF
jgi:flagellar L-ring protein FlgH